jgi:protein phosphatase 1 regulatory subunit 7
MNLIDKIENLEGLGSLQELFLFGNRIRVVENLDGVKSLKTLKLNNNRLLSISELALYDLPNLEVLNAAQNVIDAEELDN